MEAISIYLADDHAILREGLKLILAANPACKVIGECGDGATAFEEIERLKPVIVILDISMPEMNGVEVARKVKKYHEDIRIIILSRHDNREYVEQLMKYGVNGYVLKDDAGNDLLRAVEAVMKNEIYLSPRIAKQLVSGIKGTAGSKPIQDAFAVLTNREREILKLIAEGKSYVEIGEKLWISPRTVMHTANIMKKLDIHKATDLVKYAIKCGIIET